MRYPRTRLLHSIRWQLGFVLSSLLILIVGSVIATFLDAEHHDHDLMAIHLAGQQHELVYVIVYQAITGKPSVEEIAPAQQFEENLAKLRHGGVVPSLDGHIIELEPATDETLVAQVDAVEDQWLVFRTRLEEIQTSLRFEGSGGREAERVLQAETEVLLSTLGALRETLEERSYANTTRIQLLHVGTLLGASLLLLLGLGITQERIVQPLAMLTKAAQQIARGERAAQLSGKGDRTEVGELISAFGLMQSEIELSQLRLENQLAQLTRELTGVFAISQEIVRQQEIDKILEMVTRQAKTLLKAKATHLCLIDESGKPAIKMASRSGTVINGDGKENIQKEFWRELSGASSDEVGRAACEACGFLSGLYQSCSSAPLVVGSRQIGALCAIPKEAGTFGESESRYLSLLANSAAIAIANARLMKANEESVREAAVSNERERIAAELHDNIAQLLSFCGLQLEQIQLAKQPDEVEADLQEVAATIESVRTQLRVALHDLNRTPARSTDDFVDELTALIDDFRRHSGVVVHFRDSEQALCKLPANIQRQVLLILREALTNIQHHAQATQVNVQVIELRDEVSFIVADDGRGFSPNHRKAEGHYGLAIMQERARRSGGTLTVNSVPDQGTTVMLNFPIAVERHDGLQTNSDR